MTLYACARCGKRGSVEKFHFSFHTRNRYCLDTATCERRIKRLAREGREFDRGFLVAK